MADPQDIQNQQSMNEELKVTNSTLVSIATNLSEQLKLQQKIGKEVEKTAQEYYKDIARSLKTASKDIFTIATNQEAISRGALKSKEVQNQIAKALQEQNKTRTTFALLEQEIGTLTQEEIRWREDALEASEKQLSILRGQHAEAKKIEQTAGVIGDIFTGLTKIPIVGQLVEAEEIVTAINEKAAQTGSSFKALGAGVSTGVTQMFRKALDYTVLIGAQIFIIKKAFDLFNDYDQLLTDQAKQLGISRQESEKLYQSATLYLTTQKDAFLNEERILKARFALNDAMGTSIAISDKEAGVAARLSELYGVSAEENAKIFQLGQATGQTNKEILDTVIKTAVIQKSQVGGTISYQNVLKKVSGVSGDILTRFKGNVTELTKAVMQADKLGLTLEQVDKVSESLLNFETSIENELKAELLTGKALNLERARSAALSGDTSKLMSEIATQVGNIHKFERMNTLQRQAYAEAFGMSASEMGDMLRKQELEAKFAAAGAKSAQEKLDYAKANNMTLSESVEKDLEQRSLADLQKDTFKQIRSVLQQIVAGPGREFGLMIKGALESVLSIVKTFREMTGGKLGSALGALLLGFPAILGVARLMAGGLRGLLGAPGSRINPGYQYVLNGMGGAGMGGGTGPRNFVPGVGFTGGTLPGGIKQNSAGRYIGANGRFVSNASVTAAQQSQAAMSMRNMGIGMGLGMGGMALNAAASGMEPGGARTTMGVLGGAATGAGMGMMFGPWGAAIGGIIGGVWGLVGEMKASREKEEADKAANAAANKKTQEMLEDLAVRPLNVYLGPEKVNTGLDQYGSAGKFD
jgi:hypothetical protein